jgi:hypothetical protein
VGKAIPAATTAASNSDDRITVFLLQRFVGQPPSGNLRSCRAVHGAAIPVICDDWAPYFGADPGRREN